MSEPSTRPSLLIRIQDCQDKEAWRQFVEIYAPLIYRFARRHGLQDADAADLSQEVLGDVSGAAKKLNYDPQKGTFRSWLYRVARNRLYKNARRRRREDVPSGDTSEKEILEQQPSPDNDETVWNREYKQRLFSWAATKIRPEFREVTWQAFWENAMKGRGSREVSEQLGISIGAVYMAKCRVLTRLKQKIQEVQYGDENVAQFFSSHGECMSSDNG